MTEKIVVAGAGLVGAMAASFFARQGFQVDVCEQRPDLRRHDISAGRSINLALANRGIRALEQLGVMELVSRLLIPMRGRMVHDGDGSASLQPYGQKPEEVIYSVSRGALNGLLLDAAEETGRVRFHFQHELRQVDFEGRQATFFDREGGSEKSVTFSRFIGADGAGSRSRALMGTALASSHWKESVEPLDHQYKELEIPAGAGGSFQLEKHALHIWPRGGFMLIALPNLDGSFTVTLFLPAHSTDGPGFDSLQTAENVRDFFQQYFPDVLPLIPGLLEDFFNNPTGHLGTVRCAPWNLDERAILMGDAAHAIVPFHGQGMNCGFEDCAALNELMQRESGNWQKIFTEYSDARIRDANAIADMALENYVEMRNSVRDPKFLLKKAIGFELEKRFPDHFTPRYSMVMFHQLPYAEVQRIGEKNQLILSELSEGIERIDQVDWHRAGELVKALLDD